MEGTAPGRASSSNATPPTPRAIACMNQKGGVGKTTTTVNLGAAIAEAGRRVLLVDLDPQAHLTLHYGVTTDDHRPTVYDLLVDPACSANDAIRHARANVDLIPAEVDLAAAELELSVRPGREFILGNKLRALMSSYDFIMFDCPPSLGLLTLNALATAREVIVPMQAHFLALQGVGKLLETVTLVRENVNPTLVVTGIVLCAHESNTTLSREIVSDLASFFEGARQQNVAWRDCRVLEPPVRRNIKLAEAPSFGQTIFDYAPQCPGAHDYRQLALALLTPAGATPETPASVPLLAVEVKPAVDAPAVRTAAPSHVEEATASAVKPGDLRIEIDAIERALEHGASAVA